MLEIKQMSDKTVWESYLTKREISYYPFFQSWSWGEVQKKLGFEVTRLGVFDGKKICGVCQIVDVKAKRGRYFHLRHGPVVSPFDKKVFSSIIEKIKSQGLSQNVWFIRTSPLIEKDDDNSDLTYIPSIRNAPVHNMDGEVCWTLDITPTEEELLRDMRKSHRYLIKKSLGMNIKIIRTSDISRIDTFLNLYKELSERKHFVPHTGISNELEEFGKEDKEILLLAEYEEKVIAGAIIAFTPQMAIYRHGASLSAYRHIPASYILQWEAIKEAKKRNIPLYNFWGITEEKNHPWSGITLFKTGFGGSKKEFIHAKDIPLSPKYMITYGIDLYTKKLKGY